MFFFHGKCQNTKEPSQIVQTHFLSLFTFYLLTSDWPNQGIWLYPILRLEEKTVHNEAWAKIWVHNSTAKEVNKWPISLSCIVG